MLAVLTGLAGRGLFTESEGITAARMSFRATAGSATGGSWGARGIGTGKWPRVRRRRRR